MSGDTPRYATLLYEVRRVLNVSFTEYVYLDMVHKLSYERWCNKSLEHTGEDLGLSRRGVIKMRDRLIAKGLLKRNPKGELRVTDLYIKMAVNKVPNGVHKVHFTGEQSAPKNNNRNTENFEVDEKSVEKLGISNDAREEHSPAKERIRTALRNGGLGQLKLGG